MNTKNYLHKVRLHVVGHERYYLFLAAEMLGERARRAREVFVVGQTVVDRSVWRARDKKISKQGNGKHFETKVRKRSQKKGFLLALVTKAEVRSLVEEHTDVLVGELVAKTIFVGVVDPFSHPEEGLWPGQTRWVSGGWREEWTRVRDRKTI